MDPENEEKMPIIQSADRILVLDRGRIAESGTHDRLVKNGGKYASMWAASRALK